MKKLLSRILPAISLTLVITSGIFLINSMEVDANSGAEYRFVLTSCSTENQSWPCNNCNSGTQSCTDYACFECYVGMGE